MDEYINRDALKKQMASFVPFVIDASNQAYADGLTDAYSLICQAPAADVRPAVKAKWEVCGMFDDIGRCSNCHYIFPIDTAMTEFYFCPNCGAKMSEGD